MGQSLLRTCRFLIPMCLRYDRHHLLLPRYRTLVGVGAALDVSFSFFHSRVVWLGLLLLLSASRARVSRSLRPHHGPFVSGPLVALVLGPELVVPGVAYLVHPHSLGARVLRCLRAAREALESAPLPALVLVLCGSCSGSLLAS